MTEFLAPPGNAALERKLKAIDRECARRIEALFPVQTQLNILAGILAEWSGYGEELRRQGAASSGFLQARDRDQAVEMFQVITDHRHAAEALRQFVISNPANIHDVDTGAEKWWPKARKKSDEP